MRREVVIIIAESDVSIHAPWEGCDLSVVNMALLETGFNSRTLGRVRPTSYIGSLIQAKFQFTHPGKGATDPAYMPQGLSDVSIHAPWEGCDRLCSLSFLVALVF